MDLLDLPVPANPHPLLGRTARFTEGAEHDSRRAEVVAALPASTGLRAACRETCGELPDRFDAMPLLLSVPVRVLAAALGLPDLSAEVGALCRDGTVSPALPDLARTSLLFQCRDATAALVVARLLDRPGPAVTVTRRVGADGAEVVVPLDGRPWGAGRHACPGREHATALAAGLLDALAAHRVVAVGPDEDRPNMRIPTTLEVAR